MSKRKTFIIIAVFIAVAIPFFILSYASNLSKKANEKAGNLESFFIVDVKASSILVSPPDEDDLIVAYFNDVPIFDEENKKLENYEFKEKQIVKIKYNAIQETYPGTFSKVSKIIVTNDFISDQSFENAQKRYDDFLAGANDSITKSINDN